MIQLGRKGEKTFGHLRDLQKIILRLSFHIQDHDRIVKGSAQQHPASFEVSGEAAFRKTNPHTLIGGGEIEIFAAGLQFEIGQDPVSVGVKIFFFDSETDFFCCIGLRETGDQMFRLLMRGFLFCQCNQNRNGKEGTVI